jgi:hypothetical protein
MANQFYFSLRLNLMWEFLLLVILSNSSFLHIMITLIITMPRSVKEDPHLHAKSHPHPLRPNSQPLMGSLKKHTEQQHEILIRISAGTFSSDKVLLAHSAGEAAL